MLGHFIHLNACETFLLAQVSFLFALNGKRDLCDGSKLILIQPTSTTLDGTPQTACPMIMFADLNPLCSAHSFTVIPLLFSEPTPLEVSREDSVAK